jgi:dienelactone hydrolase
MSRPARFTHLGVFSDLIDHSRLHIMQEPCRTSDADLRDQIIGLLGVEDATPSPDDARVESTWTKHGLCCEEVSWSVGYGPRTFGWIIKPQGEQKLPGVLALHGHDGVKWYGKEKIADGQEPPADSVCALRELLYEGRAFANALASEGFVVLVHDAFLWGSRRFPMETMPPTIHEIVNLWAAKEIQQERIPDIAVCYDMAARHHEHVVAKYCTLIGTSITALVSYEDRIAVSYLRSRPDVDSSRVGCIGLSGGGCRAALLQATCEPISAAVVVGMMSTYLHLLDRHVEPHTWMFFPPGLSCFADWPDLAACRAPSPLMVQFDRDDQLFSLEGMEAAHLRIQDHYNRSGDPEAYEGRFYPGPHKFDLAMQVEAFTWLKERLRTPDLPRVAP